MVGLLGFLGCQVQLKNRKKGKKKDSHYQLGKDNINSLFLWCLMNWLSQADYKAIFPADLPFSSKETFCGLLPAF